MRLCLYYWGFGLMVETGMIKILTTELLSTLWLLSPLITGVWWPNRLNLLTIIAVETYTDSTSAYLDLAPHFCFLFFFLSFLGRSEETIF